MTSYFTLVALADYFAIFVVLVVVWPVGRAKGESRQAWVEGSALGSQRTSLSGFVIQMQIQIPIPIQIQSQIQI